MHNIKKLFLCVFLFGALSLAQGTTAHVYVKVLDSATQSGTTVTVITHITKDGNTIFNRSAQYYFQDSDHPTETQAQFRTRVVTAEKAILDQFIVVQKSADATEATNTDVSSFLTGITQ